MMASHSAQPARVGGPLPSPGPEEAREEAVFPGPSENSGHRTINAARTAAESRSWARDQYLDFSDLHFPLGSFGALRSLRS